MRYAIIRDGIVLNVCEWDGETPYNPGEGCTLVRSDEADTGDTYDGVRFTRPVLPEAVLKPTLEDRLAALEQQVAAFAPRVRPA